MKTGVATLLLLSTLVLAQPAALGQNQLKHSVMNVNVPIQSELNFIRGMIPHHREAVDSAAVVAQSSERPELRAFAEGVVRVQRREISALQGWLEAWYPNKAKASPYAPMMRALPDAAPDEADRAFIEDMMAHHEMAIEMAKQFLAGSFTKHPEAEALAGDIIETQSAEVATLQGWLRDWYGVKAAPLRQHH